MPFLVNKAQYREALDRVATLWRVEAGTPEDDELNKLIDDICAYEEWVIPKNLRTPMLLTKSERQNLSTDEKRDLRRERRRERRKNRETPEWIAIIDQKLEEVVHEGLEDAVEEGVLDEDGLLADALDRAADRCEEWIDFSTMGLGAAGLVLENLDDRIFHALFLGLLRPSVARIVTAWLARRA
jgi:hypothetical protein